MPEDNADTPPGGPKTKKILAIVAGIAAIIFGLTQLVNNVSGLREAIGHLFSANPTPSPANPTPSATNNQSREQNAVSPRPSGSPGAQDEFPPEKDSPMKVASQFLSLIDLGRCGDAWEFFDPRGEIKQYFLGDCKLASTQGQLNRQLVNSYTLVNPAGKMPGKYFTAIYRSSFEPGVPGSESLTLKLNSLGQWRMWSYGYDVPAAPVLPNFHNQ